MLKVLVIGLAALFAGQSSTSLAADGSYAEGEHYRTLARALPRSAGDDGKVEVLEFFWYGCPHCYRLEPYLEAWANESMPENAEFVQVPAALNPSWKVHARAFYVAKSLGVLDTVHGALMEAIHVDGKRLDEKQSLSEFFVNQGVDKADFEKAYDSFAVETGLRRAAFLAERAGINSVPSVIVAGKYETSVSMAGGHEQLLEVIDYLVAQEAEDAS